MSITTLPLINENAPGLLQNTIDRRIVRVRPMSTPVDQLSRCAAARAAKSMTVEFYSVDTKEYAAKLKAATEAASGAGTEQQPFTITLQTDNDHIFELSETVLIPSQPGYDAEGNASGHLVLYVTGKDSNGVKMVPLNAKKVKSNYSVAAMAAGTSIVRMGRAATELDVQTAQFSALPQKDSNNCQIFKMQIEQSTLARIANKEVGWNFSDQEEAAIIDMRMGMEKNFLFGHRTTFFDPAKNEPVYFTGGIWAQAGKDLELNLDQLDETKMVDVCALAFTGNSGSKRKILMAGTEFLNALSKMKTVRLLSNTETKVKWGIEFKEIVTNYGTLYVVHNEIFDQCGHSADALIIDPDYLTKYVHIPFRAESLDLRRSGVRNTDAVVLTEASCLVLRYPDAHVRITGTRTPATSGN